MPDPRPLLTLAHSPDPDDAFMWWPITGKIAPSGEQVEPPRLDTGRFRFQALPADIEALNKRAIATGDLDITALSFRCYADVQDRYALTRCGSSFGDGFGPKVICRVKPNSRNDGDPVLTLDNLRDPRTRIAIPGTRTTAFLLLNMLLGPEAAKHPDNSARFIELPFHHVIPAVVDKRADAGLVIHEGQLTYVDAGLTMLADVGVWWKQETGLPLPLGCNVIRRDLDARFGAGSCLEVARTLHASILYALEHREESVAYTLPFALANTAASGDGSKPNLARINRYIDMYVSKWTIDMGDAGLEAVRRVLQAGADAGLCPPPARLDAY